MSFSKVGALESALGLTMLESQAVRAGFPAGPADAAARLDAGPCQVHSGSMFALTGIYKCSKVASTTYGRGAPARFEARSSDSMP